MERAVSGHDADFSGIVWGLTEAGARDAPTGGLEASPPRPHKREKAACGVSACLCLSAWDKAWSSTAERMGQPLETLKMKEKKEIRCGHCNKLLGKGTARDLEIKCPRCGTLNHVRDIIPCSEPYDGLNGANHADSEEKIGN